MNVRSDFPFFRQSPPVPVYLDNAATTQKPECVLRAIRDFYETTNANVHRGAHRTSRAATEAHEQARASVASFIGAASPSEIIFTSGTTEGINLVAQTLTYAGTLSAGDEIIVSTDSHHSNIVPWQLLCERTGAVLRVVPLTEDLRFDGEAYGKMLGERTVMVAVPMVSNALGLRLPVEEIIERAHSVGARVLLDAAQAVAHEPLDVQKMGCDFLAFSGHKVFAPTGTGVLWGRAELLDALPPWKGGGEMISSVTFAKTTYNQLPFKYEAGTPHICGNIVLAEALRYVRDLGLPAIRAHEQDLVERLCAGLAGMPEIRILGGAGGRTSLVSVHSPHVHHYDLGMLLDQMNVAVRTGHHCCQPLMQSLGITGTTRYSVALYNTEQDIDVALEATRRALDMLR